MQYEDAILEWTNGEKPTMSRNILNQGQKASIASVASYFHQGSVRMKTAAALFPALDPAAALIEMHQKGERLSAVTARRYFEDDRRVLQAFLRCQKRRAEIDGMTAALQQALKARGSTKDEMGRKRPPLPKRTSALKVIDATEYEARTAFYELKEQALENHNIHSILAALFVLVCAHSGLRPIEMIGASLNGSVLTLVNAKRRAKTAATRDLDLGQLHPDIIDAVGLLIALMPVFPDHRSYVLFRNRLRQALQRACMSGNIRKLSLYSFRHVSLATWKRAGMSVADIARLAGHSSLLTARRHYAPAKVGHNRTALPTPVTDMPVTPGSPVSGALSEATPDGKVAGESASREFAFEDDFPIPAVSPRIKPGTVSPQALAAAKARWAGDDVPPVVAQRPTKAQGSRRVVSGVLPPPSTVLPAMRLRTD